MSSICANPDPAPVRPPLGRRTAWSTGEVARLLGVSLGLVWDLCGSGRLPCRRVPGSKFRRIDSRDLARLLRDGGLPVPLELTTTHDVVCYRVSPALVRGLRKALPAVSVQEASDAFSLGMALSRPCDLVLAGGDLPARARVQAPVYFAHRLPTPRALEKCVREALGLG